LYIGDIETLKEQFRGKQIATISFTKQFDGVDENKQFVLSYNNNLAEAAKNLFTSLREIDKLKVDVILAEKFPDEGIGRAINDRLGRAQAENKS
jgi:L-threonylcarbamoyladenylate synthase